MEADQRHVESEDPQYSSEEREGSKAKASDLSPTRQDSWGGFFGGYGDGHRLSTETYEYSDDESWAGDHFLGATGVAGAPGKNGMFIDAASMKERLRANMCKPQYDVANFYHKRGIFRWLATHKYFEAATLSVIALNAIWISVDTDGNQATVLLDAQPMFQIAEHFFCAYFTFEWFVRFCAFKRKRNGCKDAWFVFDSGMVFMMVAETWVMTIIMLAQSGGGSGGGGGMGNASILRLARLLRLSRMCRMARLLRAMPELMILIKGMVAAMRSVLFTLALLGIMTYIFGILFKQLCDGTLMGDAFFPTVPLAMHTLILDGCFLDSLGTVVKGLGEESLMFAFLFYVYVLLAALTVMNMLIGVLCEVVAAVASTEKEQLTVAFVKEKLQEIMTTSGLDADGDGEISKEEFCKVLELPEACRTLEEVGVDVMGLIDIADFIFDENNDDEGAGDGPKNLTFVEFMEVILALRGSNNATVKDIVDLRKFIVNTNHRLEEKLEKAMSHQVGKSVRASMSLGSKRGSISFKESMFEEDTTSYSQELRSCSRGECVSRTCSIDAPTAPMVDSVDGKRPYSPPSPDELPVHIRRVSSPPGMGRQSEFLSSNSMESSGGSFLVQGRRSSSTPNSRAAREKPTTEKVLKHTEGELDKLLRGLAEALKDDLTSSEISDILPLRKSHAVGLSRTNTNTSFPSTTASEGRGIPSANDEDRGGEDSSGGSLRVASVSTPEAEPPNDGEPQDAQRRDLVKLQERLRRLKQVIHSELPAVSAAQQLLSEQFPGSPGTVGSHQSGPIMGQVSH